MTKVCVCTRLLPLGASLVLTAGCGSADRSADQPEYVRPEYARTESDRAVTDLRFTEIARVSGIDFVHETGAFGEKWMPETMGAGGGFLDFDGDGQLDVLLVNGTEWMGHGTGRSRATLRLYRNVGGGRFQDVTLDQGLTYSLYGMGAAFADYDGDGDVDMYITAVGDNLLLRNDGHSFIDATTEAGVGGNAPDPSAPPSWSTAAAWLDYDRDGLLDLFVCNYVRWTPATDLFTTLDGKNKSYATPEQYEGDSCRLYRNRNGRRFDDMTSNAGVYNPTGKSLGVAVADLNDDAWPDLVVANDTERNFLYMNAGDGTFRDIAVESGIGYDEFGRARAGMGIDVGDVLGDGTYSIAIGNFSQEPISLYTQVGDDLYQDFAGKARLTRESLLKLTFGIGFADLNLDGLLDLVTANGHIEPEISGVQRNITFAQAPQVFLNEGAGRFSEVGASLGESFTDPLVARGLAFGDIDRDGDVDVLITVNGDRPRLFRNDLPAHAGTAVAVELNGEPPNRHAIGAVVTLFSEGRVQRRMVRTGSSYLSQSDYRTIIFGLEPGRSVDSLEVRWPTTGRRRTFGSIPVGRRYSITEMTGQIEEIGRMSGTL